MGKDQDFLEAARNGNITLIEKILSQKAKRSGPLASLRRGPGINVQDNGGYSALHYAALNGHTHIVRLLLIHEASPNLLDSRGSSPLHLASWAGHQEIVKMLLTHPYKPANPDMQTMENDTPLHCAAQHGHTGALTTLLAHGADPNVYNSRNETPLDLAAQYGRLQAVQMLIRAHPELLQPYCVENYYSSKSSPTIFTHSALHLASRNGHNNVVEILLAAGVNVNLLTSSGTALHEAALCGKDLVVRTLLEAGCDLNAKNSDGRTALDILQEFPPHVTKGIISVINSFSTRYDSEDLKHDFNCIENAIEKKGYNAIGQYSEDYLHHLSQHAHQESNNIAGISPSVSMKSFDPSMTSSTEARLPNDNFPEFYEKMAPIKMQKPPPKKPPRRNLSISPTHIQNSFINNDLVSITTEFSGDEVAEESENTQSQNPYECMDPTTTYSCNEKPTKSKKTSAATNSSCYIDFAQFPDVKPIPAPRKLKTQSSHESSVFKSYNPNRKLKRNRENYFAKGQFSLTISNDIQQTSPNQTTPSPILMTNEAVEFNRHMKTTSQEYAGAHDYLHQNLNMEPEISPHGQICQISLCDSSGSISSGVSFSDRSVSTDCVEEYMGDKPFAGLFKGSTLNLNNENLKGPGYYNLENDLHQSEERSRIAVKEIKNKSTADYQSVSSEEALNSTSKCRKYKKDKIFNEDHKRNAQSPMSSRENLCFDSTSMQTKADQYSAAKAKELIPELCKTQPTGCGGKMTRQSDEKDMDAWIRLSEIMETFGDTIFNSDYDLNGLNAHSNLNEQNPCDDRTKLANHLHKNGLGHLERLLFSNGYDSHRFMNGIFDDRDLAVMNISEGDSEKLLKFIKTLPFAKFDPIEIDSSLDNWLNSIQLMEYSENFKKHLYNTFKSVCGVWEVELQTVLEINKIGHRKRILHSVAHIRQPTDASKKADDDLQNSKSTLKPIKKNRQVIRSPAPKPPLNIEIRAPSELLIGLPSNLRIKWPHSATSLLSNPLKYEVYYLGSTVVKELRGTESTRKSIQKLKRSDHSVCPSKFNKKSSDHERRSLVQLSISYRGVEFIDVATNGTICEHEIRNINCACQDADDMRHFAYITIDSELDTHYCHVFNVDNMHLAMEIILTLAESFEVAYQMALKKSSTLNKKITDFPKPKLIN